MRISSILFWGVVLSVALVFTGRDLRADVTGTILGTVNDSTGAAIPGVSVTLTNSSTGLARTTKTDGTGSYEFLSVPAGADYVVTVEAKAFKRASQSGIQLLVNQKYRADFELSVGTVTETLNVSAQPVQVETSSTQVGDVIQDKKMSNLPLNGRSYIDLLGLQAGVVPIQSGMENADRPVSGDGNAGNLSVNGQREAANAFLVNGGDVEESRNQGASIVPVLDAIQEFRILTSSFDPEYGRFSGGIVNVVTKSGTNGLHGTGFEFLRNEKLDSRNFFEGNQFDGVTGQEIPGSARGEFRRNQFGWAVGGPILKNRLFFFSDYQGSRQVRGNPTGNQPVPSLLERTGDFSDVSTTGYPALTGTVQGDNLPGHMAQTLSSRLGYPVSAGEPYWVTGCNISAQAQSGMCVFPGQVIPQAAWDPVAGKTLQYIPTPVATSGGQPFFSTSVYKEVVNDDKFGVRIDLNSQKAGSLRFYYNYDNANVNSPYPNGPTPGFPAVTPSRAQQGNIGWTHAFGPTKVNDFIFNYTRSALNQFQPTAGFGNLTSFGFVRGGLGIIPAVPKLEGLPQITLNLLGVNIGLPNSSTDEFNNTYQWADGLSIVKGRHTAKFGGEFRIIQINVRGEATENGDFNFNGAETGNDFADYLIGAVPATAYNQGAQALANERSRYGAMYAQDSFKFRPNFTVNYGLRWEVSEPYYDTQNMLEAFVPGLQSKIFPTAPTGWVVPGDPGVTRTLAPTRYDNFAPRAGIAYSPGFSTGALGKIFGGPGKTSIRASAGIFHVAIEELGQFYEVGDAPFGLYFVNPTPDYLSEPFKTRTTGADIGQRFPFVPSVGSGPFPNFNWGQALPLSGSPGIKTDNVLPYSEHYDFSLQRQVGRSTLLSFGYVGSRGHHLITQVSFNPGSAARCLQIASLFASIGQASQGCGPFGEDSIYAFPGGAGQSAQTFYGTRPYSVTSGRLVSQGILDFQENSYVATSGNSDYDALQITAQKNVGDAQFLAAYTFSKSLDDSSALRDFTSPFDYRLSKSLSTFDMRHNFVVSYTWNLPFQRLMHPGSGWARRVTEGWQFSGITRFTSGLPVQLRSTLDNSLCNCGFEEPDYNNQGIRKFNPRDNANHQYFATDGFFAQPLGTFGTANRRFFSGPGLNNWDVALHKMTHLTEGIQLEYRAEFFNFFNHAQFQPPVGRFGTSNFGQVTSAYDPRIGQMALKLYF